VRERALAGSLVALLAAGTIGAAVSVADDGTPAGRSGASASAVPKPKYRRFGGDATGDIGAVIRRTKYGVPHITAKNYEAAAYGQAYAFAEDNLCTLADTVVTVAGERSRYFGAEASWKFSGNGAIFNNLDSDFFYGRINQEKTVERLMAKRAPQGPLPELKQATSGFVRGYNAYLRDVGGAKGVPDPRCNGKDYVRPIKEIDIYRRYFQLGSLASSGVAIDGIAQAAPAGSAAPTSAAKRGAMVRDLGVRYRSLGGLGSNAYGLGGDVTDNGRGMVLGNPHFPWAGAERLYQSHITVPGKLDVSGATLYGVPAVLIGHTKGLAWSHTVATAWRFTPFEEKLIPGDPHSYIYNGQIRKMKATTVTVKARGSGGKLGNRSRTLYETVHGPMFTSLLGLPLFPWGPATGYSLDDVNAANFRYLNHFVRTDQAQSVREYHRIQERYQGIPWVNSIAADRRGEAYYSMNGAIPNMPNDKVNRCQTTLGLATFNTLGLPVPDGSRADCAWGKAAGSADDGLLPNNRIPYLFRRDYVHNGNDSHWLTNASKPLEGYDRIVGIERAERTPRTRLGLIMIRDRLAGRDGLPGRKFSLVGLERVALGDRQYLGELWRDPLVGICRANPTIDGVDVRAACGVLARWNVHDDLDAPGALLFRRFAARAYPATQSLPTGTEGSNEVGARAFSQPFDPNRPVDTPTGLADTPAVRSALAGAVTDLRDGRLALDTTLRKVQHDKGGTPIHGGPGGLGVFNAIDARWNGKGLDPVQHGSSFIMAAQFTGGACPVRSSTFVTYGESENPASPHRTDYGRAFSAKRWNQMAFCPKEVLADRSLGTTTYVGNGCTPRGGLRSASVRRARGRRAVRIAFRRARRARVRVDLLRVSRRGLRRVKTFRRSKSFTVKGLRAGTYVARLRMKSANGKSDERRKGFRVSRGGRVRRSAAFFRNPSCGMLERFSLASPVLRGKPTAGYRLDRTAKVTIRVLRGKRTVRRIKLGTKVGERNQAVLLRKLRRGSYRVRLDAVSPGGKRARATLRFVKR
jgi:acyl-homoserine-lactone acylase